MSLPMTTDVSTVRWHIAHRFRHVLLADGRLPLADWLRDGTATVVKDGPHRAVYRVCLPGLDCHIKHYRLLGWRSRIRQMIRPNKARREAAIAAELKSRGIPTPNPIGWGVEGNGVGPAASWLIAETVADAAPLVAFIETTLTGLSPTELARMRQRLAHEMGGFIAGLHAAGVVHHDLHPGNLLVRQGADGSPHFWLIDLHAVSLGSPCPWATRRANLIVFNRYFQLRASRSDRLRFWRAYVASSQALFPGSANTAAVELERETERSNLQFWQARDARCRHTNRYYKRVRSDLVRGHAVRDFDASALTANPDEPLERPGVRTLKNSRSSTVVEMDATVGGTTRRVIYKRFAVTGQAERFLALGRPTAALRSWVFGHGLRERGLPTARPLAVFHRIRNGLPAKGYLLTEKIESAVDLHGFLRRLA
ncbi:MAG TPA: lipopolysaccharide kinase InaA family protein, partial [Gemmataceae bacterium]|nr:lipopolysaccharide kinase InaA family protein [Gemmataceae bacterium]